MEKVRPWCGQPSDRGRLMNRTEQGLSAHQYADDIQVYGRCRSNDATSLCLELGDCIEHVADWMNINRLQLNAAKTEFMCMVRPTTPSSPAPVGSPCSRFHSGETCHFGP